MGCRLAKTQSAGSGGTRNWRFRPRSRPLAIGVARDTGLRADQSGYAACGTGHDAGGEPREPAGDAGPCPHSGSRQQRRHHRDRPASRGIAFEGPPLYLRIQQRDLEDARHHPRAGSPVAGARSRREERAEPESGQLHLARADARSILGRQPGRADLPQRSAFLGRQFGDRLLRLLVGSRSSRARKAPCSAANATGGAVLYQSTLPGNDLGGYLTVRGGERNLRQVRRRDRHSADFRQAGDPPCR